MANPSVSVIIPFYNAETTLEKTLASLAAQTYRDIQIVLVNDGSTDGSTDVIERFTACNGDFPYPPILITLNGNQGVATARAAGLENATGDYVIHCDADDYMHPSYIQQLYDTARMYDADVVVSGMTYVYGERTKVVPQLIATKQGAPHATLNELPINTSTFTLCCKLIRRDFIISNDIAFFSGVDRWEDLGFVTQVLALNPVIASCSLAGYYYVQHDRGKSLSRSKSELLLRDHLMMALMIEEWMMERGVHDRYEHFLTYLKYVAKIKYLRCKPRDVAKWKQTFPEVNGRIMSLTHVLLVVRMLTRLVAVLPTKLSQAVANIADSL